MSLLSQVLEFNGGYVLHAHTNTGGFYLRDTVAVNSSEHFTWAGRWTLTDSNDRSLTLFLRYHKYQTNVFAYEGGMAGGHSLMFVADQSIITLGLLSPPRVFLNALNVRSGVEFSFLIQKSLHGVMHRSIYIGNVGTQTEILNNNSPKLVQAIHVALTFDTGLPIQLSKDLYLVPRYQFRLATQNVRANGRAMAHLIHVFEMGVLMHIGRSRN